MKNVKNIARITAAVLFTCASVAQAEVNFDWVTVGDPGNAGIGEPHSNTGRVNYEYRISKYEVTNSQYVEFLNTVDQTGANDLDLYNPSMSNQDFNGLNVGGINLDLAQPAGQRYSARPGRGNKPVTHVSFTDATRFTNWLHNGQGSGDTESGVSTFVIEQGFTPTFLQPGTDPINGIYGRNVGAQYFLPSYHEWYKAAYYKGGSTNAGYWTYATQSNTEPTAEAPPGGANSANFGATVGDFTDVGSYTNALSAYGTLDQTGNVQELTAFFEFVTANALAGGGMIYREGSADSGFFNFMAFASDEDPGTGFRVASPVPVPEPASVVLLGLGLLLIAPPRRDRTGLSSRH